ncbi:MAG: acyltransferase [Coriobacteriia bacterium]|nr:acyltransferase [Coriobacteriia bacterium]
MRRLPGLIRNGRVWRMRMNALLLRATLQHVGSRAMIDPTVWFEYPEKISLADECEIRRGAILNGRSSEETGIVLGKGVHIHQYACLDAYGGFIHLGEGVRIGRHSVLSGHGGITFGAYSGVAGLSYVIASNHQFRDTATPHVLQESVNLGINIGENVWGGCGVVIADGVNIGDNCVIGAGSVVRQDVPSHSVVLGNPARVAYTFEASGPE